MLDFASDQDFVYVIYIGVALGTLLLFTGVGGLLHSGENRQEAKSRRLRMINKGSSPAEVLELLKPTRNVDLLDRLPFIGALPSRLSQAGLIISPATFLSRCAIATFLLFVTILFVTGNVLQAGGGAFGVGFFLPLFVLRSKQKSRLEALVSQLPDALDLMARGLQVGHPLNISIGSVAEEMPDPIGSEFGIIFDQISFGDDLSDAFREFSERVDLEDVYYLSASIGIQHGTGGDLVRVIKVLAEVVRGRIALRRKIKAITAEGRLSAWFLSAIPVVIFGFTSLTSPDYYGGVAEDPLYIPFAIAVLTFTLLNYLVLRKLVNFHI
jgi:tight adherence protein B